jgi:siderophore ferric iron reductase
MAGLEARVAPLPAWLAGPPPNADLGRILALAERVVPGFSCRQGSAPVAGALRFNGSEVSGACGEPDPVRTLCRHWTEAHPEAGAHYAALRCWGLAIWQPVYLGVICAQLGTHVPRLAGLAQPLANGFPVAVHLPVHAPVRGDFNARVDAACDELRAFCDAMRAALMPLVALHDRAADALQAECVLGALLAVQRYQPALAAAEIAAIGEDWLARLGIPGGCGVFSYLKRDGHTALALDRTVCCHHFRRADGEKCATCPKLALEARVARLQEE